MFPHAIRGLRLMYGTQEDATSVHGLQLPVIEVQTSLKRQKVDWKSDAAGSAFLASQVAFFGIYDG